VTLEALATDETLLILKIVFLVLLYAFILMVMRTATKDLGGAPQESIILGAAEADEQRAKLGVGARPARFVAVAGPGLQQGRSIEGSATTVVGRDAEADIRLDGDEFASAQHARLEVRDGNVWVEDLGSTNGTFVNGAKVTRKRRLRAGDALRIGQTELRLER
jgi:FHA domain